MSMSCTRKYIPCYRTCSLLMFEPQLDFDNRKQGTTLCISFKRTTDRTSLYSATVTYSKRDANFCVGEGTSHFLEDSLQIRGSNMYFKIQIFARCVCRWTQVA